MTAQPKEQPIIDPVRIRLAGINIGIRPLGKAMARYCRNYICDEEPELWITMTPEMLDEEMARSLKYHGRNIGTRLEAGRLAVYRRIAEYMPRHDTFLMHASAISFDGQGYLFTGPSGAGKTTHAQLWKKEFGDRVTIINDDKPLVRANENEIRVYGTPWCGKERRNTNTSAPLKGIIFLKQADENRLTRIDALTEVWERLMHQTYRSPDPEVMQKILELLGKMIERVPVYEMACTPDAEAARTARAALITQIS